MANRHPSISRECLKCGRGFSTTNGSGFCSTQCVRRSSEKDYRLRCIVCDKRVIPPRRRRQTCSKRCGVLLEDKPRPDRQRTYAYPVPPGLELDPLRHTDPPRHADLVRRTPLGLFLTTPHGDVELGRTHVSATSKKALSFAKGLLDIRPPARHVFNRPTFLVTCPDWRLTDTQLNSTGTVYLEYRAYDPDGAWVFGSPTALDADSTGTMARFLRAAKLHAPPDPENWQ